MAETSSRNQQAVSEKDTDKNAIEHDKSADLVFVQQQEVIFTGPFSDWIHTFVTIINPSNKAKSVFKFQSNCKRNFTVRPVFGIIEKGGAVAIKVTCRPLKAKWLSSKHRLTLVVASVPQHKDTPDAPAAIWMQDKPWCPKYTKTIIVPVKYRHDDGSEIGGSAGEGTAATSSSTEEAISESATTLPTDPVPDDCPASLETGECNCGMHANEPAPEPVCNCGADHGEQANALIAMLTKAACGSHGDDEAKALGGSTPVCTCVAEGELVTAAAVATLKANCESHKTGGSSTAVCTCGTLTARATPPLTADEAAKTKAVCGKDGTAEAKTIAGPNAVCTCGAEGTIPSAATIAAVTANCASHGVTATKNGKSPGAICTCLTAASADGLARATAAQSAISKTACSKDGSMAAKKNPAAHYTCTCVSPGGLLTPTVITAGTVNCGTHGLPAARESARTGAACTCIVPPPGAAPATNEQADVATESCGRHGTSKGKLIAGSHAVCTCVAPGAILSAATIAAIKANCGSHGTTVAKAAARPNPICTCIPTAHQHAKDCKTTDPSAVAAANAAIAAKIASVATAAKTSVVTVVPAPPPPAAAAPKCLVKKPFDLFCNPGAVSRRKCVVKAGGQRAATVDVEFNLSAILIGLITLLVCHLLAQMPTTYALQMPMPKPSAAIASTMTTQAASVYMMSVPGRSSAVLKDVAPVYKPKPGVSDDDENTISGQFMGGYEMAGNTYMKSSYFVQPKAAKKKSGKKM